METQPLRPGQATDYNDRSVPPGRSPPFLLPLPPQLPPAHGTNLTGNLGIHLLYLVDCLDHYLLYLGDNLGLLVATCIATLASDYSPLQDFCVAAPNSPVMVNGLACKDPKLVQANGFFFSGLHLTGSTSNAVGSRVTPVTVAQLPGLTLLESRWPVSTMHHGVSTLPTHTPVLVGFVTSNPENRLITKVLFVFPEGLMHFQWNVGSGNTVAIAALSSPNPGVITIANAVFSIPSDILTKAFQIDNNIVSQMQSKF
ncbi:hypothetical protein RJ640_018023 [Escallonia rubra]|uniref:Germin-like protein n=1 Tax=Escallonia rubra TaxID=112253 RepID=A0AA88RU94_9ASTE|nr:hypothetical protein RJ640_018023 [Escallonia rubra]